MHNKSYYAFIAAAERVKTDMQKYVCTWKIWP